MRKRYLIVLLLTLSALVAHAQWTNLSGPPGGDMRDIEVDGSNKLYTVVAEKIYTSTNDGASWTQLVPTTPASLQVYDVLVDGASIYALTYSYLYKSDDGGANWTRLNSASASGQFYGVEGVIKVSNNTFAVFGWNGVFVSSDGGVNWTKINTNTVYSAIATTTGDLYMADVNLGVRKHPAGTWAPGNVTTVYSRTNDYNIRLGYKGSNNTIFLTVSDNIYKSTNGFSTAPTSVKTAVITDTNFGYNRWTVAPGGTVYFGNHNTGALYSTTNDGTSWVARAHPASNHGNPPTQKIIFTTASVGYAATAGDGIFKTTDGGTSWNPSTSGINFFLGDQVEVAANGNIIVAAGFSHGYWFSTNAGATWTFKSISATHFFSRMTKMPNNTLLAHGSGILHYSSDNGTNWTASAVYRDYIAYNTTAPSGTTVYGTNGNTLSSSTDGANWTTITVTGMPASYNYYGIAEDDGGLLYARIIDFTPDPDIHEIYQITLTGATTATAVKLNVPFNSQDNNCIYCNNHNVFVNNNKVYVSTGQNIYYSSNQGTDWGTISFSHTKAFGLVDGARKGICASASGTLYVTQDDGQSWASYSLPSTGNYNYIAEIAVDASGDFYAATYNSPALKNTANLLVDPSSLPPYIAFNWQSAGGPYGGYMQKVLIDDAANTYTFKDGYLYKTTNFASWTRVNNPNGYAYDYIIDRSTNPDKIIAMHWTEIRTSIDGGATWQNLNNTETNINYRNKLQRCSNGDIVMAVNDYNTSTVAVYVSTNGGTTFGTAKTSVSPGYFYNLVTTSTATPGIFVRYYNSTLQQEKIIRSLDRGITWAEMVTPTPNICSITASGTELYLIGGNSIYKSTDNGATWTNIKGDFPTGPWCAGVFKSPTNELFVYGQNGSTGSNYGFFKSVNNGTNWTYTGNVLPTSVGITDVTWQGTRMVVATEDGIFTSDNGGVTYTAQNTGIPWVMENLELVTPQRILSGAGNAAFTYNLTTWTKQTQDFQQYFRMANGRLFACTWNEIFESTDNGANWTRVALFPEGNLRNLVTQDGTTFFASSYNKLFYTNNLAIVNNQTAWTEFSPSGFPAANDRNIQGVSIDPSGIIFISIYNNPNQVYEAYQIIFGTAIKLNQIVRPRNIIYSGGKTIIYDGTGAIFSSPDGTSFSQRAAPGGEKLIITEKNYFFITVSPGNLWLSRDEGQTWQQVGLNNNEYFFTDVVINEYNGYAYAAISGSEVRKSANIVIPDDATPPGVTTLVPANNATNVAANTQLSITFNEVAVPVAAKKIRIFESTNQITPVEEILVTSGVQNGKTFTYTLTTALTYLKTYIITFENGAFRDIHGNVHPGILNPTTWRFTIQDVPDATAPAIAYTQANFTKGASNSLSITATDNAGGSGINASTVKLFYRKTMSTAAMAEAVIPFSSGNTYQISIPDTWVDELGLEFYFSAADVAGNTVRLPSGTAFYTARIAHTEANEPSIPTGFIGVGGKAGDYRMFSIPYDLQNGLVGSIFDELGASDKTLWRIVQYVNSTNTYTDATSLSRGTGYWINTKTAPSTISVEGAATPNDTKTNEFKITLQPGWNLIGNPYPFTINWATVKAGNVAIGDAKSYNGSFITDNLLSPFEAAFVNLSGSQSAVTTIPFSAKSGRMHDPLTSAFDGLWLLPLTIETGDMKNDMGGVGMHEDAVSGFDQFDDAPLPRLFDFPELHFSHPEYSMKNFTRDVVPVQDEFEWRFVADVQEGQEAVLSWDTEKLGDFDKELFLLDESTQLLINMLEQNSYSFLAAKSATFRVYYGADLKSKIKPTSIMLGKPYPNPTQSSSSVSFTLPENATGNYNVVLDVYDMVGNKITTLTSAQLTPGFHTTAWSPEQQQISSGVYIYKLMVSDNTTKKILTEKLLIKK